MSLQVTQSEINLREKLVENKQRYGIKGKQLLEADLINEVRSLIGADNKNLIINGNFDIWQRGINQTSYSGIGADDRWRNVIIGSTQQVTRESFSPGQTEVSGNPKYYSKTVANSVLAAGNLITKRQKIESVKTFAGQTVTLSFWAKADSPKNIATEFRQHFGNGGSPSSPILAIGVTTHNLTTDWKKFVATSYIPNIEGKTLGTDNDDTIQMMFWFDAGANHDYRTNSLGQQSGIFDIAQVQLEYGDQATEFEQRSINTELKLCQYYYQKSYNMDTDPGTATHLGAIFDYATRNTSNNGVGASFKTKMRTIPSVTLFSSTTGTIGKIANSSNGDINATAGFIGEKGWSLTSTSGGVSAQGASFHYIADAEL